jgi:hypothetical protein
MDIGDLDVQLRRRHHIEAAYRRRAQLPQNLRQLGAVGAVTKPGGSGSQPVLVKVTMPPKGGATTRQHVAYLQHHKGQALARAPLYGPGAQDPRRFMQAAQSDPHQFRIIVSTQEDQLGMQRTAFIESLVHHLERDLGRPLDWVAANHYDTPYPHTHLVVRGMAQGAPLYMAKSYVTHGIQDRASALLTRILGERHQQTVRYQVDHGYAQERTVLNSMVRGPDDPDLQRLRREVLPVRQSQGLGGQLGSFRQEQSTGAVLVALAQMQQRVHGLHHQHQQHQMQWMQAQRREG